MIVGRRICCSCILWSPALLSATLATLATLATNTELSTLSKAYLVIALDKACWAAHLGCLLIICCSTGCAVLRTGDLAGRGVILPTKPGTGGSGRGKGMDPQPFRLAVPSTMIQHAKLAQHSTGFL